MVTIRQGVMKDCTDLLEVYQGTRWFHRVREGGYTTLEDIKNEHRGASFVRWGWLVAEERGRAIGEIVFRYEKNPIAGRIGIIRNLDVDVRNQKTTIGTQLTRAAENVLRKKKVARVIATTPPSAYNYWMKVNYFARGSIINISLSTSKITKNLPKKVKAATLKDISKLPKSMKFSHIAYPGALAELVARIIKNPKDGKLMEFYSSERLVGVGAIMREDAKNALFVTDVTKHGLEYVDAVVLKTIGAASSWNVKKVRSVIPKDSLGVYSKFPKWSSEMSTDIPVTRLL